MFFFEIDTSGSTSIVEKFTQFNILYDTTYYFTFFTKDTIPNYSPGVSCSCFTLLDTFPPDTITNFSITNMNPDSTFKFNWVSPPDTDFHLVSMRYSFEYYPEYPPSPDSGRLAGNYISSHGDTVEESLWVITPGVHYYFSAFSIDQAGNFSPGVHGRCITPILTSISLSNPHTPVEGGLASWLDSIGVTFTAPLQMYTLENGTEITGREDYDFRIERLSGNTYSFIPPAFSSLDTVQVTLHNSIIDSIGQPFDGNRDNKPDSIDDYEWYFYTGPIGDYTCNGTISIEDFAVFREVYEEKDITRETGPCTGTLPYFTLTPDSIIDFEDFSMFILMWNWSLENRGIPSFSGCDIDSLIQGEYSHSQFRLKAKNHQLVTGGEIVLYNASDSMVVYRGAGLDEQDVFILKVQNNKMIISFGTLKGALKQDEIAIIGVSQSQQRIDYSYRILVNDTIREGKGTTLIHAPVPGRTTLSFATPNPGKYHTITYGIPKNMQVTIDIFDITGRKVAQLYSGYQQAGYYDICWNGKTGESHVPSGKYFIRLTTEEKTLIRSLTHIR
jgi:hypothetical protein